MYSWFQENIWIKLQPITNEEIEIRKEIAREEMETEKEELITEIKEMSIGDHIWNKIINWLSSL